MIRIRRIVTTILGRQTVAEPIDAPLLDPAAEAERQRLEADYRRTHPENVERISGCCDRADQA